MRLVLPALPIRPRAKVYVAIGCVGLFLLPFAGVGLLAAVGAFLAAREGDRRNALGAAYAAIVFGTVGFGGIAFLLANRRKMLEMAALKEAAPDAPWLWRPEWASGQLVDPSRARLHLTWIFAAFWNAVVDPITFLLLRSGLREGPGRWAMLLNLLPGALLLAQALHRTLRFRRFGVSRLDLATVPGVIGRSLAGVLRVPVRLHPPDGFRAVLTCTEIRGGRGSNASTRRTILWQEEQSVRGEAAGTAAAPETRIPIAFDLPPDARPYDTTRPRDEIVWSLRVSARVPGVDYDVSFDVPVFRTAESDEAAEEAEQRAQALPAWRTEALQGGGHDPPAGSRLVVARGPRRTEIYVRASRNRGPAFYATVVVLLTGALAVYLARTGAPVEFPALLGGFALLCLYMVLVEWLQVTRVMVRPGALTWATGYLAPGRERTLLAVQIADVTTTVGMHLGETAYHDVTVVRTNGRKIFLARFFRHKPEAEWLAAEIRRVLAAGPAPPG